MAAPVGPKKVHRYTLQFKVQAVQLANHPEIQTRDVAHALSCTLNCGKPAEQFPALATVSTYLRCLFLTRFGKR